MRTKTRRRRSTGGFLAGVGIGIGAAIMAGFGPTPVSAAQPPPSTHDERPDEEAEEALAAHERWTRAALALDAPASEARIVPRDHERWNRGFPIVTAQAAETADFEVMLRVMAVEARLVIADEIPAHVEGEPIDLDAIGPLMQALHVAAHPTVKAKMNERQKYLVAALAIVLLDDERAVSDERPFDGPLTQIRHWVTPILDSLAGGSRGYLYRSGGLQPPGFAERMRIQSRDVIRQWREWWITAAAIPPAQWRLDFTDNPEDNRPNNDDHPEENHPEERR